MYQMPQSPLPSGSPYYRMPPRRAIPPWVIVVAIVTVGLCILCASGTFVAVSLMKPAGLPALAPQALPASVGDSLTINNVTVTLTSATVGTWGYSVGTGEAVPAVTISLHFWNKTTSKQALYTTNWRLFIDGGTHYYNIKDTVGASLQPNETQDVQFTVMMNTGDQGPYILQSNFTTPQGQPLAWKFTG